MTALLTLRQNAVSGQGKAIGRVRPSECFHSVFWTKWPVAFIFVWAVTITRRGLEVKVVVKKLECPNQWYLTEKKVKEKHNDFPKSKSKNKVIHESQS